MKFARALLSILLVTSQSHTAAAETKPTDPALFRQIFYNVLQSMNLGQSQQDFNRLLLQPPADFYTETTTGTSCAPSSFSHLLAARMDSLCGLNKKFDAYSPTSLLQEAAALPGSLPLSAMAEQAQKQDILIVIVPGIFGEFIDQRAFEEVMSADSSFREAFVAKAKAARANVDCESSLDNTSDGCTPQEMLSSLTLRNNDHGLRSVELERVVHTSSVEAEGKTLAKVMLLNVEGMSLESLGDNASRATTFNNRLEQAFRIMGRTPRNIVLVGYSRGTDFALEMLAQAKSSTPTKPWLKNVRGVVSLGGVVFGSALADDAVLNPKSDTYKLLLEFGTLVKDLTVIDEATAASSLQVARVKVLNTLVWWRFLVRAAEIQTKATLSPSESVQQTLKNQIQLIAKMTSSNPSEPAKIGSDPMAGAQLALRQLQNFGALPMPNDTELQSFMALYQSFQSNQISPATAALQLMTSAPSTVGTILGNLGGKDYFVNIKRFKKLGRAAITGISQLTTADRIDWWKKNSIPTGSRIRYYSVSATMDAADSRLMSHNTLGYNPGSPDDTMLAGNWQQFRDVQLPAPFKGSPTNDSQVTVFKTMFWPQLIAQLNPANRGLIASPLAVFGTHHWGLALPVVNKVSKTRPEGVLDKNPFPRTAVMKAIALTVSHDIAVEDAK